mgnify:CR=1 FL=1
MTRLISSDSHVNLTHDVVKQHLDPQYHDAYDAERHKNGAAREPGR